MIQIILSTYVVLVSSINLAYAESQIGLHNGLHSKLCGPKSLVYICSDLRIKTSIGKVAKLSHADKNGNTTLLGLCDAARKLGLDAVGVKITLSDLGNTSLPCIAYLWCNHCIVIKSVSDTGFVIVDPPGSPQIVTRDELSATYAGFALLMSKNKVVMPEPGADEPDIRIANNTYDFGVIDEGKRIEHIFKISNMGNRNLTITNVRSTCACVAAEVSAKTIAPNAIGEVKVVFDSQGRHGQEAQRVYIQSDDPIVPISLCIASGTVRPRKLFLSSPAIRYGFIRYGESSSKHFFIQDPGDGNLELDVDKPRDSHLSVSQHPIVTKDGEKYIRLTVSLKANAAVGELNDVMIIHTNFPRDPLITIPITANILGNIDTYPRNLFLGFVEKGKAVKRTIRVSSIDKKQFHIRKLESPSSYVSLHVEPGGDDRRYELIATLSEDAIAGLITGDIVIETNLKEQPHIKIPYSALVQ